MIREDCLQERAQGLFRRVVVAIGRYPSHQTQFFVATVAPGKHDRVSHTFDLPQAGLDFPEFYAKATDLHLMVKASHVLNLAVGTDPRQIARPVHARTVPLENIRQHAFRCKSGAPVVAPGYAQAAHIDFTDLSRYRRH